MSTNYDKHFDDYNSKLNDICVFLDKEYPILINNIHSIANIVNKSLISFSDVDFNTIYLQNTITNMEVFELAKEVVSKINPEFENDFERIVSNGELDFINTEDENEENKIDLLVGTNFSYYSNSGAKLINVVKEYNYSDVVNLVHEFFHYENYDNDNDTRSFFTEFFSIYYEQFTIDYLIENKKVDTLEMDVNYRERNFVSICEYLSFFSIPLICYNNFGNISEDSYEKIINSGKARLTEEVYNYYVDECYSIISENNLTSSENLLECNIALPYKYLIDTLAAFYAKNNCDKNKILDLYKNIGNFKNISIIDYSDIFKTLGIDIFSKDFFNKAIEEMYETMKRNKRGEKKCLKLVE